MPRVPLWARPPINAFLQFLLACLGAFIGASLGFAIYVSLGGRHKLAVWLFPFLFFGFALTGFYGVTALWMRYLPARCTRCGATMTVTARGKQLIFTCTSCGYIQ